MLNVNQICNHPSSCRILLLYGGSPRQFSNLKKFRALVVAGRGYCEGIIPQVILTHIVFLPNLNSCLIIKGGVTGVTVNAPTQRNSL